MTSDKQNNGNIAKPFTPSLSAAFHRSNKSPKSPLTPKLANPGGYRTPRRYVQSEHPLSNSKDDSPAVGPNYLSANVTPRSGSRATRRDGSTSSPTAVSSNPSFPPHTSYSQPVVAAPASSVGGYRSERSPVRVGGRLEPARSGRAKTLTTDAQHVSRPNSPFEVSSGSRMFFHASDARSSTSSDPDTRPKPQSRPTSSTTFIYANGEQERKLSAEETASVAPTVKRRSIGPSRPVPAVKTPSASPRLRSPKLSGPTTRVSDGSHSQVGSQIGSQIDDASETGSQRPGLPLSHFPDRPSPVPIGRHMKSASLDSTNASNSPREGLRPSPILISPSDPQVDSSAAASEPLPPLPALRPRIFSHGSTGSADTSASGTQSPSKSEAPAQANDPHAHARTERKIMDLEISNSSLLAINRTLEREMRKQAAELRRFRRMSQAGRLSMPQSTHSVSGTALSVTSEMDEGISELSSAHSPEELSDFSDEDSTDEGAASPGSNADQEKRHEARDEKRFFIDLAKHQEVLADSQQINQSLKRCLGWTEDLIKEGKKALEYSVHVNDIELGGRVLAPEELAEVGESARGLLSSTGDFTNEDSTLESNPDTTPETS
ncbi:hypothetical protein AWENTII_012049 [Aspergillus wentii]